ncbi:tlde1 domain-containing protein [Neorhizobium alkalisoli]|uniref:Uncharacterized protein DUF2778 n=1 Tax=Neorhizobium alkalisoli TaxID=528178 RepID=A0A561QVD9_9HYPH|nr:tlde1 domain-containing protein [Neorhizobium alkalisoli]TWF54341.1 uncharacterized protein DUF2778 [Neorhizobium alkalisoli]
MARSSAVSAANSVSGKKSRKAPVRRKKSRSLLFNMTIGFGLAGAALFGASLVTVATSVKSASGVKFETALVTQSFVHAQPSSARQVAAVAERDIDVSKFSRLPGSASAEPKAGRLAGADLAALSARKPDAESVRQMLHVAMAKASRHEQSEQQFASLEKIRPDAAAIKAVLGPAMASLVVVAPRGENDAMPDLIQGVQPAVAVADLKDMQPVEMASLEDNSTDQDDGDSMELVEEAPIPTPAPEMPQAPAIAQQSLPKSGPLPVILRPSMPALASADAKPAKPNALAAIAAVAPQKTTKDGPDDEKPTVLAFAKPDNPMREEPQRVAPAPNWPGIGAKVAVYDITGGVVYMPNGTKLEAHSGIGGMRDNPSFTHVKMRGPTPPGTYKLSMRESLFHGVAAIRLTPTDGKAPQGRTGLLAHSFLLRVRGDSHGCVAFAEYDKFLGAFKRGEVTHMVIVPKYDGKRPGRGTNGGFMAKLFGNNDA